MAELYTIVRKEVKQGDTIKEFIIEFGATSGIDLTNATVRMQVYWNGSKKIDVSNGNGITINNALKLTIDERLYNQDDILLPEGTGKGDIEFTFPVVGGDDQRITLFNYEQTIVKHYTV